MVEVYSVETWLILFALLVTALFFVVVSSSSKSSSGVAGGGKRRKRKRQPIVEESCDGVELVEGERRRSQSYSNNSSRY